MKQFLKLKVFKINKRNCSNVLDAYSNYFISNNTKDFGDIGANKSPENEPYSIHPNLFENNNITAYKHVQGFIIHNDLKVKEIFKDIHSQMLSEVLFDKVKEELEEGLAKELVHNHFTEQIFSEARDLLADKQPEDLHPDFFMGGYVDPTFDGDITDIRLNEIEIYGEEVTVAVDVDVEIPVEIYLYNPVYDNKDEKFQYHSTDIIKVEESLVFIIPVDIEQEIDVENFSFKEYIQGIEPDNLNVEIIEWLNIDHVDMYPDEYEDYNDKDF